ncbi:hypothetical protein Hanom_Chr03g00225871 [Helianthus anomalus]
MVVVDKPMLLAFWDVVCRKRHLGPRTLQGDGFLYLHSLIASSITTRGKIREWCMSGDLFFFYCLLYKRSCALAHDLALYFDCAHLQHEHMKLYSGAYICDSPFVWLSP